MECQGCIYNLENQQAHSCIMGSDLDRILEEFEEERRFLTAPPDIPLIDISDYSETEDVTRNYYNALYNLGGYAFSKPNNVSCYTYIYIYIYTYIQRCFIL